MNPFLAALLLAIGIISVLSLVGSLIWYFGFVAAMIIGGIVIFGVLWISIAASIIEESAPSRNRRVGITKEGR